ncbi:MAG: NADH-quinone oxidoreductase subunit J [Acidimicrobiales bacterium]|nr:NADH-quinone oxidoreductase subunit J [Acidimicrobiales bacterium]
MIGASFPDELTFFLAAIICVIGALGVVLTKHPVRAALSLVMTLFGVAVLFVEQQADFLAAVQVIVYAGAIVVLFLFVIMLLGVDKVEAMAKEPLIGQRIAALLVGLGVLALIGVSGWGHWYSGSMSVVGSTSLGSAGIRSLAEATFTTYLLPFEVTSILLIIVVMGAVVLVRRGGGGGPGAIDKASLSDEDLESEEAQ